MSLIFPGNGVYCTRSPPGRIVLEPRDTLKVSWDTWRLMAPKCLYQLLVEASTVTSVGPHLWAGRPDSPVPFYIRDLSIRRSEYVQAAWNQSPTSPTPAPGRHQGVTISDSCSWFRQHSLASENFSQALHSLLLLSRSLSE